MTSFAKRLRALDPRRGRARAEDRDARRRKRVGDARDERGLGADDDEVGRERARELDKASPSSACTGWQLPSCGDAGVPGRCVQLGRARALRELPGERVLAPARPDEEHLHRRAPLAEDGASTPRRESTRSRTAPVPIRRDLDAELPLDELDVAPRARPAASSTSSTSSSGSSQPGSVS